MQLLDQIQNLVNRDAEGSTADGSCQGARDHIIYGSNSCPPGSYPESFMDRLDLKKEPKLFLTLDTCLDINDFPRSFWATRYDG